MLNNLLDRIRLPFRKEKELYLSLYTILGFYPKDINYYKLALMHKSIMRKEKGKPINNERLEFLGDAILGAVVGHIVYDHFEGKREGFLTNTRSKLVQRETLNKLAQELGITQLIMSSGHSMSHNSYLGGNAYKEVNFKSKLIEWSQKNRVDVEFRLLEQKKDDSGSPVFEYQAFIENVEGGKGRGYSKKESQQLAAKLTLERLRREPQYIDAVFAAKTERTKMEEMPVENVPDTEQSTDFIIDQSDVRQEKKTDKKQKIKPQTYKQPVSDPSLENDGEDEFDLSDISAAAPKDLTKEDIIAAAEEAAFSE